MLIIAKSMRDLRIGELMEVYAQSNLEKTSDWPNLPKGFALQLAEQDFRQYLQEVFFRTQGAICGIWQVNGKYVSALRLEPYRDGLLLEGLETAPDFRRKGYAAMLIQAVQQFLREQGAVKLYSHVEKRNIASLNTHFSCDFQIVSDCAVYINGNMDYRCYTLVYEA